MTEHQWPGLNPEESKLVRCPKCGSQQIGLHFVRTDDGTKPMEIGPDGTLPLAVSEFGCYACGSGKEVFGVALEDSRPDPDKPGEFLPMWVKVNGVGGAEGEL